MGGVPVMSDVATRPPAIDRVGHEADIGKPEAQRRNAHARRQGNEAEGRQPIIALGQPGRVPTREPSGKANGIGVGEGAGQRESQTKPETFPLPQGPIENPVRDKKQEHAEKHVEGVLLQHA